MRIGAMSFVTDQSMHPADLARAVEDAGLDSFWVPEKTHVPTSRDTPWPGGELPEHYRRCYDPFVALSVAAAVTERIRIGTGVCLVALHDPIVLAKAIASLDHVSGGRFELGVGYGWNAEELAGHGIDLAEAPQVLADKLALMTALWTEPESDYTGPHCQVEPCWARPDRSSDPDHPCCSVESQAHGSSET
jgi:probable F420-dependent oxidoreductase